VGAPMTNRPAVEASMLDVIRAGTPRTLAGPAVGISSQTFFRWMRMSPHLRRAVEEAEAESVYRRIKRIEAAAKAGDPRADMWFLERSPVSRAYFGPRVDVSAEVSGNTTHTVKIDASPQALATAISMAMAALGAGTVEEVPAVSDMQRLTEPAVRDVVDAPAVKANGRRRYSEGAT
jgi:hypothetical protein